VKSNAGSQLDLDNSGTALVTAQAQLQLVRMQNSTALNQLLGNPELPLEQFPAYMQAKAALDDAQRNLDLTPCARRWRASRRRSSKSSSAASSSPARRYSP